MLQLYFTIYAVYVNYSSFFVILSSIINTVTVATHEIRNAPTAIGFIPNTNVHATAKIPPSVSTTVYLAETCSPQYLHFPLRLHHDIIGIISFIVSSCPQLVHIDFPCVNCLCLGSLYITTLRNENILAPIAKNIISIKVRAAIIVNSRKSINYSLSSFTSKSSYV